MATTVQLNEEASKIDVVETESTTTIYEGYPANRNAADASSAWAIKRTVMPSTGPMLVTWANGNTRKYNVWANRATLTYLPTI